MFQLAEYVDSAHHGHRRSIIMMSAPGSIFSPYQVALLETAGSVKANRMVVNSLAGNPAMVVTFVLRKLFAENPQDNSLATDGVRRRDENCHGLMTKTGVHSFHCSWSANARSAVPADQGGPWQGCLFQTHLLGFCSFFLEAYYTKAIS